MERYKLLKSWLLQTLADKPELLTNFKGSTNFYAELMEIWCDDIQKANKEIVMECAPKEVLDKINNAEENKPHE